MSDSSSRCEVPERETRSSSLAWLTLEAGPLLRGCCTCLLGRPRRCAATPLDIRDQQGRTAFTQSVAMPGLSHLAWTRWANRTRAFNGANAPFASIRRRPARRSTEGRAGHSNASANAARSNAHAAPALSRRRSELERGNSATARFCALGNLQRRSALCPPVQRMSRRRGPRRWPERPTPSGASDRSHGSTNHAPAFRRQAL